jgi:alcohol dehydrogenase (cytochrome c)
MRTAGLVTVGLAAFLTQDAIAIAQEVTHERLLNSDQEPQNWLTNHGSYGGQRYSLLDTINTDNASELKLAFAVALAGQGANEYTEQTSLAEDGFLYVVDGWGVVYKIDTNEGLGRILWRMDPGAERHGTQRGTALLGNAVYSVANEPSRIIATDKATGEVLFEAELEDQATETLSVAPLAVKDMIVVGAAGGDSGTRDWIAAIDAASGDLRWRNYVIPAPGEPGSETWKGNNNAWQTGGGGMYVTGTYDPDSNLTIWGTGNPVPMFDPTYRPGDNLYTNSAMAWNVDSGELEWYFQYTPGDMWDYDEEGTHIIFTADVNGTPRNLVTHSARNGFVYTFDTATGEFLTSVPYMEDINWTAGIDPKTGKPVDYNPELDLQVYAGVASMNPNDPVKAVCPTIAGGNNFWPSAFSQRTNLLYVPAMEGCVTVTMDTTRHGGGNLGWQGGSYVVDQRLESSMTAVDPVNATVAGRVAMDYPNYSGALATAGGLVFTALTDGTVLALDDTTLETLWSVNVGVGFTAPPMTYAAGDRQYVAITSGLSGPARGKLAQTPEVREQRNLSMLFVFGL